MAGAKGRSGGARIGAGRKPRPENDGKKFMPDSPTDASPLDVLQEVMRDSDVPLALRIKAAQAAAPYVHAKRGEGSKKDDAANRAKAASAGKFGRREPPKLVAAGGKPI